MNDAKIDKTSKRTNAGPFSVVAVSQPGNNIAVGDENGAVLICLHSRIVEVLVQQQSKVIRRVNQLAWIGDSLLAIVFSADDAVVIEDLTKRKSTRLSFASTVTGMQAWGEEQLLILTSDSGIYSWAKKDSRLKRLTARLPNAECLLVDVKATVVGAISQRELRIFLIESGEQVSSLQDCISASVVFEGGIAVLSSAGDIKVLTLPQLEFSEVGVISSSEFRSVRWIRRHRALVVVDVLGKYHVAWQRDSIIDSRTQLALNNSVGWTSTDGEIFIVSKVSPADGYQVLESLSDGQVKRLLWRKELESMTTVLHISDLHFKNENEADHACLRFEEVIRKDKKHIDYIVISGDVSDKCSVNGYKAAVKFVTRLAKFVGISDSERNSRIVIIPGNHDIDFEASGKAYRYLGQSTSGHPNEWDLALKEESNAIHGILRPIQPAYDQKRLAHFNTHFYKPLFGREYPPTSVAQAVLVSSGKDSLAILGLNSAFRVDHIFRKRARIDPAALHAGMEEFKKFRDSDPNGACIIVVHHAIGAGSARIPKRDLELSAQAGVICILHGDIHEIDLSPKSGLSSELPPVLGGGFGGISKDQMAGGTSWIFHYIEINWGDQSARAITRTKYQEDGEWFAHLRYTAEGKQTDTIVLNKNWG